MPEDINRRRQRRLACTLSVQYCAATNWHAATVLDLTDKGCRLRLGEDLALGTRLRLRFDVPLRDGATSAALEVEGTLMWCQRQGLSRQAGLAFSEPPADLLEILRSLRPW